MTSITCWLKLWRHHSHHLLIELHRRVNLDRWLSKSSQCGTNDGSSFHWIQGEVPWKSKKLDLLQLERQQGTLGSWRVQVLALKGTGNLLQLKQTSSLTSFHWRYHYILVSWDWIQWKKARILTKQARVWCQTGATQPATTRVGSFLPLQGSAVSAGSAWTFCTGNLT